MLKNLSHGLWGKLAQLLRTLPGVTKWRGRYGVSAVSAELLESLKKTSEESRETIESLKKASDESIESSLNNLVSGLNALLLTDSREAYESNCHSQIMILVHDMERISQSTDLNIEKKSEALFLKADELIAKANFFETEYNVFLPDGTSSRFVSLVSESNRTYKLLNQFHGYVISILSNFSTTQTDEIIANTFDAFKFAGELLTKEFNVFKNEHELLGKLKTLANLYLLAISRINPSGWILEFKSVCLNIVSLIENSGNSELIPFEVEGKTIYLSPDSAEGKALNRINNPVPDDEWIVIIEEGQEVDVASALERLKKRGYKVKV